jgi:hypothetical protein
MYWCEFMNRKYQLISVVLCLMAFFLVKVGDTVILSLFLRLNGIQHTFSFFYVEYGHAPFNNWTEGKLIFIHSVPYLLYVLAGLYLPHYFRNSAYSMQLAINWISFHAILSVMAGIVAGLFIYYGPGVALTWFFVNMPVRIAGVIVILVIILIAVRRFAWYFMFSLPDTVEVTDHHQSQNLLRQLVLFPFMLSFLMIIPFVDMFTLLNFIFTFILGLIFFSY